MPGEAANGTGVADSARQIRRFPRIPANSGTLSQPLYGGYLWRANKTRASYYVNQRRDADARIRADSGGQVNVGLVRYAN